MKALILLPLLIVSLFGQIDYWPEEFRTPSKIVSEEASGTTIFSKQQFSMGTYTFDNLYHLLFHDSLKRVEQSCKFTMANDHNLNLQNYVLNLEGSYLRKKYPFDISSLGIEWTPAAYLNRNKPLERGSSIGSLFLGPVLALEYMNMPIRLSGGGAVDVWPDSLPYSLAKARLSSFNSDNGFYGKVNVGDNRRPLLESVPFYAQGSIFGKYMSEAGNSKVTSGEINALFVQDVPIGDTLFIYCADTLTKGRTAFFNEYGANIFQFTNLPNKTINSFQAAIGIKNIDLLFFKPSFMYKFDLSTIKYLPSSGVLGDLSVKRNIFSTAAQHTIGTNIDYKGGFSIILEEEDHLFKSKLPTRVVDGSADNDSLKINSNDFTGYISNMFHFVNITLPNDMKCKYHFTINKHHKSFPNYYSISNKIYGGNDNDRVNFKHLLEFQLISSSNFSSTVVGEYIGDMNIYLKKENSANNRRDWIYHVAMNFFFNSDGTLPLKESIGVIARTARFDFPEFKEGQLPPMSRNLYSRLSGEWHLNEVWNLEGYLNGIYRDDGFVDWQSNLYNISDRKIEVNGEGKINRMITETFVVRFGSLAQILYNLDYDFKTKSKYRIVLFPFVEMTAQVFNKLQLDTSIRYSKVKNGEDHWEAYSFLTMNF